MLFDGERVNDLRAVQARHRHGVPELRALPAHDGLRQHGLRPEAGQGRPRTRSDARVREGGRACCRSTTCSTACPSSSRAASASASPSAAPSCATRACSCSTSRCRTSTRRCASQTRLEIAKLHHDMDNVTMIYVTHDQVEAMTLADRICVLRDGRGRAGRHAARALRPAELDLRRGLHRQPQDELPRRRARRGRTAATPSASGPSTSTSCRRAGRSGTGTVIHAEDLGSRQLPLRRHRRAPSR